MGKCIAYDQYRDFTDDEWIRTKALWVYLFHEGYPRLAEALKEVDKEEMLVRGDDSHAKTRLVNEDGKEITIPPLAYNKLLKSNECVSFKAKDSTRTEFFRIHKRRIKDTPEGEPEYRCYKTRWDFHDVMGYALIYLIEAEIPGVIECDTPINDEEPEISGIYIKIIKEMIDAYVLAMECYQTEEKGRN